MPDNGGGSLVAALGRQEGRRSEATPAPLRRDVRLLAQLLGQVLEEAGGPELLADVERLRRGDHRAALGRRPPTQARPGWSSCVASFDLDRAELLGARAFTVYFQLVNLAEEHHRVRTLRERHLAGGPVRESFAAAVQEITEAAGSRRPGRPARPAGARPGAHRAPHRGPAPGRGRRPAPDRRRLTRLDAARGCPATTRRRDAGGCWRR